MNSFRRPVGPVQVGNIFLLEHLAQKEPDCLDNRDVSPSISTVFSEKILEKAKRLFDLSLALSLLVIFSPMLVLISIVIWIDSPGSPIYHQWRRGRHNKRFRIYKFRTMRRNADLQRQNLSSGNEMAAVIFKIRHDPRVTRVGRFLRRTSLDELPQFLNVVLGQMSLVGPRPFIPAEFETPLDEALYRHWVNSRHRVLPGITGLWQINGRNDLPLEQLMRLDLHYVHRWTPMQDIGILFKTIGVVFSRKGAY